MTNSVALMDYQPVTVGHVLVMPRHHASLLDDLDENLSVVLPLSWFKPA